MSDLMIKKINLDQLNRLKNEGYFESFDNLPISSKRVFSYLNNNRKITELPVLYLGFINEKLVTYRSVLQDICYTESDQLTNVIWISGSWTHPNYRRKGLSDKIFDEVSKDYRQNILITNYGNDSKGLYSRRKELNNFRSLDGYRFYFRLSLEELLPPKSQFFSKIKLALKMIDWFGNLILDTRFKLHKNYLNTEILPAEMNDELNDFISKHNQNSLFRRNVSDFKWILEYPWVEENREDIEADKKYYFTTSAKRFYQKTLVLKSENEIKGFIFYVVKNEVMKIHYIFCDSNREVEAFSKLILNEIRKEKLSYVLMTDKKLIQAMKKRGGFIFSKVWKKGFFAGDKLLADWPEIKEKEIYMGDGDTIFT